MKLFRRIFRMALLPALLLVCSIHVSAANYYASTPEELLQILSYSYGQNNVIYLTADIDASGVYLQTKKDTGYIIRSDNGSSLSNATIGGTGEVTIEMDVAGLTLEEFVTVTVNGRIDGFAGALCEGHLTVLGDVMEGLNAEGSAVITVEGDVYGVVTCIRQAALTVEGSISGELTADHDAVVTIKGNVKGNISGYRQSVINIGGNVTSNSKDKWTAVYAHKASNIHIAGNVTGKGDGISAQAGASITVDGNVTAGNNFSYGDSDYTHGGTAVSATGASTVTVGGKVTGGNANGKRNAIGGHGIWAWSESGKSPTVTVKGNVTGGNAHSSSADPLCALAGMGIHMSGGATVSVGGHALGGTALGVEAASGCGVFIGCEPGIKAGSLKVSGTVAGGEGDAYTNDLEIEAQPDPKAEKQKDFFTPTVLVGHADYIKVSGFDTATNKLVKGAVVLNIRQTTPYDHFWDGIQWRIQVASSGSRLAIHALHRTHIPAKVIEAARKKNMILTVSWDGGKDLILGKGFAAKVSGSVSLAELYEKLNPALPESMTRLNKPIIVAENHLY